MKIWKRFVALTMTLAFCFLLGSMPAYAVSENLTGSPISLEPVNEALYILQQQKKSNEALVQSGWSTDAIKELRSVSLEEHFLGLKEQSYDQLKADGFTTEQIRLIYAYDGEPITENSAVLAAGATCEGEIIPLLYGYNRYSFTYSWEWSSKPIMNVTDTIEVIWQAYNATSEEMDCDCVSKSGRVYYYYSGVGTLASSPAFVASTDLVDGFVGCRYSFEADIETNYNGTPNVAWSKHGLITVTLENNDNNMSYIKVGAALSHQVGTASMNLDVSATGFSLSFSPSATYKTEAAEKKKITYTGATTENF